jgi:hypothetical protein
MFEMQNGILSQVSTYYTSRDSPAPSHLLIISPDIPSNNQVRYRPDVNVSTVAHTSTYLDKSSQACYINLTC